MGSRRVLAVSRAPQHVERDLLLIEAEGLAPIGLVLVLVGVRLFERAGRRHRKQLETIAAAAQRIGDGERDVALVAGRSEVGRVAGSLEQLANGLRELDRERGLYVSQVSHDLRNPLAVIGTYASVLRRGERSQPRAAKLQTIENEVSRLALMVDDLLALGRTHALAMHIQRAPADVARTRARRSCHGTCTLGPHAGVAARARRSHHGRRGCAAVASGTRQLARQRHSPRTQRGARRARTAVAERAGTGRGGRRSGHRPAAPAAPLRSVRSGPRPRRQFRHRPLDRARRCRGSWRRRQRGCRSRPGCALHRASPAGARPGRSSRDPIRRARPDARAVAGGHRPCARAPGPRARIAPRGRRVADCGTGPPALAGRGGDRARTRCRRGADCGLRPHAVHAHPARRAGRSSHRDRTRRRRFRSARGTAFGRRSVAAEAR